MTRTNTSMFIVFLRFGPNRTEAGRWMAGHKQWIEEGIADGVFLVAGSLDNGQGGVVIAAGQDLAQIHARVGRDPFVVHGVVSAEVHALAPSLMAADMARLLDGCRPMEGAR